MQKWCLNSILTSKAHNTFSKHLIFLKEGKTTLSLTLQYEFQKVIWHGTCFPMVSRHIPRTVRFVAYHGAIKILLFTSLLGFYTLLAFWHWFTVLPHLTMSQFMRNCLQDDGTITLPWSSMFLWSNILTTPFKV